MFPFWIVCIIITLMIADQKKLSKGVYLVLAIFTGPLAILIAFLERSKKEEAAPSGPFTLQEAPAHLLESRRLLKLLQEKIESLEKKVNALTEPAATEPGVSEQMVAEGAPEATKEAPPKQEGFEMVFGKYWLSRIGVVLFVIGIGLFIKYTFQYLNAFAKVGIGYAFCAAFFVWGNYLEKRPLYRKIAWGILGGAWGLLYLSTFAMYYFPATKIIAHPFIELVLLAVVSIAAVLKNLKYDSWVVTAMSFSLAFITAGLGAMDYSSIPYYVLLAGSIAVIACRRQWSAFFNFGIVASYITHLLWSTPGFLNNSLFYAWNTHLLQDQFQIIFSILTAT